jgi:hypothetical protein
MIGVLVRDEDRRDRVGGYSEPREPRDGIAHPEAAVDEDPRITGFDDETVAFAAAAQGGEAHVGVGKERPSGGIAI